MLVCFLVKVQEGFTQEKEKTLERNNKKEIISRNESEEDRPVFVKMCANCPEPKVNDYSRFMAIDSTKVYNTIKAKHISPKKKQAQ